MFDLMDLDHKKLKIQIKDYFFIITIKDFPK